MSGICCSVACCGIPQLCMSLISNTTALALGNTCANLIPSGSTICSGAMSSISTLSSGILSSCSTMCGALVSLIGGIFCGGSSGGTGAALPAVMQGATGK